MRTDPSLDGSDTGGGVRIGKGAPVQGDAGRAAGAGLARPRVAATSWVMETVDTHGHVGQHPSVAVVLQPDIVQQVATHAVLVELAGIHSRGHTAVDWLDRIGREPRITLVLKVDAVRLWEMMLAAVR